jgi:hypothetical protein
MNNTRPRGQTGDKLPPLAQRPWLRGGAERPNGAWPVGARGGPPSTTEDVGCVQRCAMRSLTRLLGQHRHPPLLEPNPADRARNELAPRLAKARPRGPTGDKLRPSQTADWLTPIRTLVGAKTPTGPTPCFTSYGPSNVASSRTQVRLGTAAEAAGGPETRCTMSPSCLSAVHNELGACRASGGVGCQEQRGVRHVLDGGELVGRNTIEKRRERRGRIRHGIE